MRSCIYTNSPEFKALQDKYNAGKDFLRIVIDQYLDETGLDDYNSNDQRFLDYLENKFKNNKVQYDLGTLSFEDLNTLWEKTNHSRPFESKELAENQYDQLVKLFGKDNVVMYETRGGNYIVKAAMPINSNNLTLEEQNILDNAPRNEKGQLLTANGKVSNLNEKQYAQVRTKAFKDWFGDWETYNKIKNARVIWGHPGTGKTWMFKNNGSNIIDFDSEYKSKRLVDEFGGIKKAKKILGKEEYNKRLNVLFDEAKAEAEKTGKQLLVSDLHFLTSKVNDIDVVTNISDDEFIKRSAERNEFGDNIKLWKADINSAMNNVPSDKIINHTGYINDLLTGKNVSKVVDENNEPLLAYHTGNENISTFNDTVTETINKDEEWVTGKDINDYIKEGYPVSNSQIEAYNRGEDVTLVKGNAVYTTDNRDMSLSYRPSQADAFYAFESSLTNENLEKDINNPYEEDPNKLVGEEYKLYNNVKNPLIIDAQGKAWNEINHNGKTVSTRDLESMYRNSDYDGIIIKNVKDYGPYLKSKNTNGGTVVISYKGNQIKSATEYTETSLVNNNIYYQQGTEKPTIASEIVKIKQAFHGPIKALGSIKKIQERFKQRGIDSDISNAIITAVQNDKSLMDLSAIDILKLITRTSEKDLSVLYEEALIKPVMSALEEHLKNYFSRYGIEVSEQDMSEFGDGVLGGYDILNKMIYLSKNRNSITAPEEFAHAFVELMGPVMSRRAENKDFTFLMANVESTQIYKDVFEKYKNNPAYQTKDGKPDIYKIKKEAIGQAIAAALVNNYEESKASKSFWEKVKAFIDRILSKFSNTEYISFDSLVNQISKDILNNDHSRLNKINAKDYNLLDYSKTLAEQTKKDGGKAVEFLKYFTNIGNIITGSLSYRYQGSVYRPALDSIHDIDMIVPRETHNIQFNEQDVQEAAAGNNVKLLESIEKTDYFKKIKAKYPELTLCAAYPSKQKNAYITVNAIWCTDSDIIKRFQSYTGSYADRLSKFTEEERGKIYLMDFFLNDQKATESPIIDKDNNIALTPYTESFREKQMMGRAKDIFDYQMYRLFDGFKRKVGIKDMMFQTIDDNPINEEAEFNANKNEDWVTVIDEQGKPQSYFLSDDGNLGIHIIGLNNEGIPLEVSDPNLRRTILEKSKFRNQTNNNSIGQATNNPSPRTITYTPTGKTQQTYTISGSNGDYHIYNKDGKEVFKTDSKDRRKIFANLAVQEGRAVVIEHKNQSYVVNQREQIISVKTGDMMKWGNENGDRREIIQAARRKFNSLNGTSVTEGLQSTPTVTQQQIEDNRKQTETLTPEEAAALAEEMGSVSTPEQIKERERGKEKKEESQEVVEQKAEEELNYNMRESTDIDAEERKFLSDNIMSMFSWTVTALQSKKDAAKVLLGESYADKDYTKMTREQIIKEVGVANLLGIIKEQYYNPFSDINAEYYSEHYEEAEKLQFVYDNWDAFVKNGYAKLIALEGIGVVLNKPESINESEVNEAVEEAYKDGTIEEKEREYWQVGFRNLSARSSLSQTIKREFESLTVKDKDGKTARSQYGYNFPSFVNSDVAVNSVLDWCKECLSIEEMEDVLKEHADSSPWVNAVLEKVKDEPFRSLFYNNFRKDFTNYSIVTVSREDGRRVFKPMPINTLTAQKSILNQAKIAFNSNKMKGLFTFDKKTGTSSVNIKGVEALSKEVNDILKALSNSFTGKKSEFYSTIAFNLPRIKKIFNEIGVDLDLNTLHNALVVRTFQPIIGNNPAYQVLSEINNMLNSLKNQKGEVKPFDSSQESSLVNAYKFIIKPIESYIQDGIEASTYENGKMYYSFNTPSYFGKLQKQIRGKDYKNFIEKEYGYTRFFKDGDKYRCPWLEMLNTQKSLRDNFQSKVQLSFDGTNYTDLGELSYAQSLMTEYFSFKNGDYAWYRIPILSNKPSSEFIKFKRFSSRRYKEIITDGFKDIALQEILRIKSVLEKTGDSNVEGIKNYDISKKDLTKELGEGKESSLADKLKDPENNPITRDDLVKGKKMRFNKSGARFHFLPMLNSEIINNTELGQMLVDKIAGKEVDEERFSTLFNEAVKTNMEVIVASEMANYERMGLFDTDKYGNFTELPFETPTLQQIAAANKVFRSDFKTDGDYLNALQQYKEEAMKDAKALIEEYIWNDMFATMNIIEMTTTDLAFYKNAEDFQKRFAQIHSPGLRLNKNASIKDSKYLTKDGKVSDGKMRTIYIKDNIIESELIPDIEEIFNARIAEATGANKQRLTEMKDSIIKGFKEINVADAQGYSSPTAYRKKLAMQGKWDDRMEEAYQRIRSGNYDIDDLGIVWQPIKPFVFTNINKTRSIDPNSSMSTMRVPMQNKNSEYMLLMAGALAQAHKNSTLGAIFDFMEESAFDKDGSYNGSGIDTIQFESAGKVGLMGIVDLNGMSYEQAKAKLESVAYMNSDRSLSGNSKYNTNFVHEYDSDDYSIQQEVPAHLMDHAQMMGSQIRVLIAADFNENDDIVLPEGTAKFGEVKAEYFRLLAENVKDSYDQLREKFGGSTRLEQNRKIEKLLRETILSDPKYGADMLDACTLNPEGEFNIPLDDPIQANRIQELLNSIIKSRINKQKVTGGPIVQVSNFGLTDSLHIVFEGSGKNKHVKHFECMMTCPSEELERDLTIRENGKERLMTVHEAISRGILTEDSPVLQAIGYRIPTEDKYSMAPLKIVGFLSRSAGEGIMLPKEITLLSGSDFDIDKLYLMLKSVERSNIDWNSFARDLVKEGIISKDNIGGYKGMSPIEVAKSIAAQIETGSTEFSDNSIEDKAYDYYASHKSKYGKLSYDENTDINSREGRDNRIFDLQWGMLTSPAVTDKMFNPGSFDVQKKTSRIVRVLSEVKTDKHGKQYNYKELQKLSIDELDDILENNAKELSIILPSTQIAFHKQNMIAGKLIGVFANNNTAHAFMENAYITLNHINTFKINGRTISTGTPIDNTTAPDGSYISKTIASFLAASVDAVKDPVLNFMNINTFTVGPAMVLARLGFDSDTIGMLMSHPTIKALTDIYNREKSSHNVRAKDIVSNYAKEYKIDLRNVKKSLANVDINKEYLASALINNSDRGNLLMIGLFDELLDIATDLQEAIFNTKFNSITNAAGPSIADTITMKRRVERFSDKLTGKTCKLSSNTLAAIRNNPLVKAMYDYTIGLGGAADIMFKNFFENSSEFYYTLTGFEKLTGKIPDEDTINDIFNEVVLYRLSGADVLKGSESERHSYINGFPKYFLNNIKGKVHNALVDALQYTPANDKCPIDTIELNTGSMTTAQREALTNAWTNMMKDEKTKPLAIQLFKYNLYRHGMAFSPKTFINLASVDVKQGVDNYVRAIEELSNPDKNTQVYDPMNFLVQYLRNHFDDDSLFVSLPNMNIEEVLEHSAGNTYYVPMGMENTIESALEDGSVVKQNDSLYFYDSNTKTFTKVGKAGVLNNILEYDSNTDGFSMKSVIGKPYTAKSTESKEGKEPLQPTENGSTEKLHILTDEDFAIVGAIMKTEILSTGEKLGFDFEHYSQEDAMKLVMLVLKNEFNSPTKEKEVEDMLHNIYDKYEIDC